VASMYWTELHRGATRRLAVAAGVVLLVVPGVIMCQESERASGRTSGRTKGVLFGVRGGTGGGVARLAIEGRIGEFAYQKPFPFDFAVPTCIKPGAIWTVDYRENQELRGGRYPEIVRARCSGETDEAVRSAVTLVEKYLLLVAEGRHEEAYGLMAASWRRAHTLDSFTQSLKGIDFSGFLKYRPSCVDVAEFQRDKAVVYAASCFIRPVEGAFTRRFSLVWNPKLSRWEIADTRQDAEGFFRVW